MNRIGRTVLVLSTALGLVTVGAPASVAAAVDRASMKVETSYLIRANLSFAAGTISARQRITVTNRSGGRISKLNLSVMPRAFGELTSIGRFTVDGAAVAARWTNNSNLELQLGRDVPAGATVTVRLAFAVKASSTIGTSLEGRLSKANGIMQVSHWFPIVSDGHPTRYPGDSQHTRIARKFRVELTTDSSSVRIAAPGTIVSSSGRFHVYELSKARDFAFGASPNYRLVTGSAAGVKIRAYATTGDAAAAVSRAAAAISKFESVYGQYQWARLVIAQTGRTGSGNEYPGIVFLGGPLLADRVAIAHEIAHQWWYAMAGNDQLREPWLDEGLAEFSSDYFFGSLPTFVSARPVNSSVHEFPNVPAPETSDDPDSYDQTVYFKASRFLDTLRLKMGTGRFFDALRDLFAANRNGIVTSREFYDTMARFGAPTAYMNEFIRL